MAIKNVLLPYHAIVAGDMSGNLTSPITDIGWLDNVCVQLNFTGTPTGTFFVDGSLDDVNFIQIALPSSPVASGAAGQILLDLNQLSFKYIRVRYAASGGSGSLDMFVSGKAV